MKGEVQHTELMDAKVLAPSFKELMLQNLDYISDLLIEGGCDHVGHYDCQMCLELNESSSAELLGQFLSNILALSYEQKALFCYVYFCELSELSMVAHLYGRWVGEFDKTISSVSVQDVIPFREKGGIWESSVHYDY